MARILTITKKGKSLRIDVDAKDIFSELARENKKNNTNVSTIEMLEAMEMFGLCKRC